MAPSFKFAAAAAAMSSLLALGGCADPGYGCPLNNTSGYCASPQDAYQAAKQGGGDKESVFAGKTSAQIHQADKTKVVAADPFAAQPAPPTGGQPVYQPGRPWRVWIAPWFDQKAQAMHGGQYVFFSTPSKWGYGTLTAPGVASGIMGPISPMDLGFSPSQQEAAGGNAPILPKQTLAPKQ